VPSRSTRKPGVEWRIERLARAHERAEFRCGKPSLDEFLQALVNQYEKRNLGRTFIATRAGEKRVYGYYTLASGSLPFQSLPQEAARKLPKHPVPVVLLARLAVDQTVQGCGLGEALLVHAMKQCLQLAETLGIHAIEVDAIDPPAAAFYAKYGFVPLLDQPLHLYLPIATIRIASDI
jgi:GNAT superfamily N-acetyltransferase